MSMTFAKHLATITFISFGSLAICALTPPKYPVKKEETVALRLTAPLQGSPFIEGSRDSRRQARTIWGSTGLIFIPSAYTVDPNEYGFGMAVTKDFTSASGVFGIVQDVEVGASYLSRSGQDNKFIANAKVHILPSNFRDFELGIGVLDAADAANQTFYFVASADLITPALAEERGAVGMRVHAGVGTGYFSEKPFAGGELFFPNGFSLVGEWDTKNFNTAVRYAHDDEFFIEAGTYSSRLMVKMSYVMRF
ncbi:MAG: hypothetical protein KF812_07640 [Fimbriimonadaceae bacterium]|nr:hypothetical protein [Fimbriimonadaceae bacterium]